MVLLAILCAAQTGDAYGVTIHEELERRTNRSVSRGAVYMTVDRLEKKGLLRSHLTEPLAERGGRARRCYTVTEPAFAALHDSRRALMSLWQGLRATD